mgnify:CR=1 FL=1
MHPCVPLILALILGAPSAAAQEVRDFGTTGRGILARDATATFAGQAVVDRAGVDCRVTNGIVRGRDAGGSTQYEVACHDAPGFIVMDGPTYRAVSCLALSGGSAGCRLRENADTGRHYARMAELAGVDCEVEDGRLVGLNPAGDTIYEIGCAGPAGYWLEKSDSGWRRTDCLTVWSQGGECRLTSRAEGRMVFRARLSGTTLEGCAVNALRTIGYGENGVYYEVACGPGPNVVAHFDPAGELREVIPCAEASRIGDGCIGVEGRGTSD